jgi:hypothetical protein
VTVLCNNVTVPLKLDLATVKEQFFAILQLFQKRYNYTISSRFIGDLLVAKIATESLPIITGMIQTLSCRGERVAHLYCNNSIQLLLVGRANQLIPVRPNVKIPIMELKNNCYLIPEFS